MKKINVAELLKNCPMGMELDCTMFDNVTFVRVDMNRKQFPIEIAVGGIRSKYLTKEGCFHDTTLLPESKCVIFPKGKTTWEGFQRPFKDGDIVVYDNPYRNHLQVFIFKNKEENNTLSSCYLTLYGDELDLEEGMYYVTRLATEEEKQKLFDTIKANGYKWNAETKTLDKLINPKFKVGDRIKHKYDKDKTVIHTINYIYYDSYGLCDNRLLFFKEQDQYELVRNEIKPKFKVGDRVKRKGVEYDSVVTITRTDEDFYEYAKEDGQYGAISVKCQDDWELVPNKFDITTLKPFDKVLVRDNNTQEWFISFFSHYNGQERYKYSCMNNSGYAQCIPYEVNKELLGTTNDCGEYYKTWEERL